MCIDSPHLRGAAYDGARSMQGAQGEGRLGGRPDLGKCESALVSRLNLKHPRAARIALLIAGIGITMATRPVHAADRPKEDLWSR